ncbi:hypothetical protein AAFF_G00137970 [Aldrovandia affinis]|uniref:Uncharacterized protein n=1 Tax=Aldrovandia affinis TaxID=143900 RepID=A0AAD7TC59_9TELE|nr:hypothetical protein AAFF_G00137970 [Aldrovandia affinis]
MSRQLKTPIPVAKLLEACIVDGVTDKLRHRRQLTKYFYHRSARSIMEIQLLCRLLPHSQPAVLGAIACTKSQSCSHAILAIAIVIDDTRHRIRSVDQSH